MSVRVGFYGPSNEAWAGGAWGIAADLAVWLVAIRLGFATDDIMILVSMLAFFLVAFPVTAFLESHR